MIKLTDLKEAVNADYIARTFHQAAAVILEEATMKYPTETAVKPGHAAKLV